MRRDGQTHEGVVIFSTCCFVGVGNTTSNLLAFFVWVISGLMTSQDKPLLVDLNNSYLRDKSYSGLDEVKNRSIPIEVVFKIYWRISKRDNSGYSLMAFAVPVLRSRTLNDSLITSAKDTLWTFRMEGQKSTFASCHGVQSFQSIPHHRCGF